MKRIKIVIAEQLTVFCEDIFGTKPDKMVVYRHKYDELKRQLVVSEKNQKTDQDKLNMSRLRNTIEFMWKNGHSPLVTIKRVDDIFTAAEKEYRKAVKRPLYVIHCLSGGRTEKELQQAEYNYQMVHGGV